MRNLWYYRGDRWKSCKENKNTEIFYFVALKPVFNTDDYPYRDYHRNECRNAGQRDIGKYTSIGYKEMTVKRTFNL